MVASGLIKPGVVGESGMEGCPGVAVGRCARIGRTGVCGWVEAIEVWLGQAAQAEVD